MGGGRDQEEDLLGESDGSFSLSPRQQLYGFAACFISGLALMLLSIRGFEKPIQFAVMFCFGNLLAIGSTTFLMGSVEQVRMMMGPVRGRVTAVYMGFVINLMVCALVIHSKVQTLITIAVDIFALLGYSVCYIPFPRRMVSELFWRH